MKFSNHNKNSKLWNDMEGGRQRERESVRVHKKSMKQYKKYAKQQQLTTLQLRKPYKGKTITN